MTCPRELRYRDGKLWQTPVRELEMLREEELHWQGNACDAPELDASRLEFELSAAGSAQLELKARGIKLRRIAGVALPVQFLFTQHFQLTHRSLPELAVAVAQLSRTGHLMDPAQPARVRFEGASDITLRYWSLRGCMVE